MKLIPGVRDSLSYADQIDIYIFKCSTAHYRARPCTTVCLLGITCNFWENAYGEVMKWMRCKYFYLPLCIL